MKEIYANRDFEQVALRRTVLEAAGIACVIRNETSCQFMLSVGGLLAFAMPVPQWWPNLCVINEEDVPRAMELLHQAVEPADAPPWKCPRCGEEVPATIAACWNCAAEAPELSHPNTP